MLKVAVFRYLFWLVLVVVFITGATRISVFGLGYLLACFYLLLFGTSLQQKDTRARLVLWDCLILDRKSTRLNSSHKHRSRMPSSA